MTNFDQARALRAAILSLQSGLLSTLEFLELLAEQSSNPSQFKQQIQAIKDSLLLLEQLPPIQEDDPEELDS